MSYGRNFDFRSLPRSEARHGRFLVPSTALSGAASSGGGAAGTGHLPIGVPVVVDKTVTPDGSGHQTLKLATSANISGFDDTSASTSLAVPGQSGILVYEFGPAAFAGDDPYLTTYSDKGEVPLGESVQVISGDPTVKVVFTNTVARTFLTVRSYPGRVMVAGMGATPTVAVGDYLLPGTGDDTDGYWAKASNAEGAWMVVTAIDVNRLQVEAQMLF